MPLAPIKHVKQQNCNLRKVLVKWTLEVLCTHVLDLVL